MKGDGAPGHPRGRDSSQRGAGREAVRFFQIAEWIPGTSSEVWAAGMLSHHLSEDASFLLSSQATSSSKPPQQGASHRTSPQPTRPLSSPHSPAASGQWS